MKRLRSIIDDEQSWPWRDSNHGIKFALEIYFLTFSVKHMRRERVNYYARRTVKILERIFLISDLVLIIALIRFLSVTALHSTCEKVWLFGLCFYSLEFMINMQDAFCPSFFPCGSSRAWNCFKRFKNCAMWIWLVIFMITYNDCKQNEIDNSFLDFFMAFVIVRLLVYLILLIVVFLIMKALRSRSGGTHTQIQDINSHRFGDLDPTLMENETRCSICLSEYHQDTNVKRLPCRHVFCSSCIDEWLLVEYNCPLCRCDAGTGEQQPLLA
jgi:hypothetical protein